MSQTDMTVVDTDHDFTPLHAAMQRYVDLEILPGVSSAVLVGRDLVDVHCTGLADRAGDVPLAVDHIHRAYSNTKLVTSCAVLLLWEEGHFQLDDPIEGLIPQLGDRQVLRPGATEITDTEEAKSEITIRHLLSHASGLGSGFLEPEGLMTQAYTARRVIGPDATLAEMMDILAPLPLAFHPGTSWGYSCATDVLARMVEIISGQPFDAFLQSRIFDPLGMVDTGFHVPPENHDRLAVMYSGADLLDPMKGGLTPLTAGPLVRDFREPVAKFSGAGGLVSTLPDMVALIRALMPGENMLLQPGSMDLIRSSQLPEGRVIRFPELGDIEGKAFGAAGAVSVAPGPFDHPQSTGEVQWGGLAGTHWWFSPQHNIAGLNMTQRMLGFWNPYSFEFKKQIYDAVLPR